MIKVNFKEIKENIDLYYYKDVPFTGIVIYDNCFIVEQYYVNGILHREDGPAEICKDGKGYYYLYAVPYSYEKYILALKYIKLKCFE